MELSLIKTCRTGPTVTVCCGSVLDPEAVHPPACTPCFQESLLAALLMLSWREAFVLCAKHGTRGSQTTSDTQVGHQRWWTWTALDGTLGGCFIEPAAWRDEPVGSLQLGWFRTTCSEQYGLCALSHSSEHSWELSRSYLMEVAFGLTKGGVSILLHAKPVSDHPDFLLPFTMWYRIACMPSNVFVI